MGNSRVKGRQIWPKPKECFIHDFVHNFAHYQLYHRTLAAGTLPYEQIPAPFYTNHPQLKPYTVLKACICKCVSFLMKTLLLPKFHSQPPTTILTERMISRANFDRSSKPNPKGNQPCRYYTLPIAHPKLQTPPSRSIRSRANSNLAAQTLAHRAFNRRS
jgi:hypothetical protein